MHPGHTCGGGVLAGHGSSMAGACIQGTLVAVGCWQGTGCKALQSCLRGGQGRHFPAAVAFVLPYRAGQDTQWFVIVLKG